VLTHSLLTTAFFLSHDPKHLSHDLLHAGVVSLLVLVASWVASSLWIYWFCSADHLLSQSLSREMPRRLNDCRLLTVNPCDRLNRCIRVLSVRRRQKQFQTRACERIGAVKIRRGFGCSFGHIGVVLSQHFACLRRKRLRSLFFNNEATHEVTIE